MNAIVLCGGRGSRLAGGGEKPLREVAGAPMIERVRDALRAATAVDTVHAAVSPDAPETADWVRAAAGIDAVETPGEGYVPDLGVALDAVGTPAVTVPADVPLLAGEHVDRAVAAGRGSEVDDGRTASVSVRTPARLKRRLGVSADEYDADPGADGDDPAPGDGAPADDWLPTGLNVVGDGEGALDRRSWDARLAVNVNYEPDLEAAEELLGAGGRR